MLEKYFFLIILKTRNDSILHICEPGSTLNGKILRFSGQTHICVKLNTAARTHQEDIVTGQRSKNQIENQTILFPFYTHCKYWPMLRNAFLIHLNFNTNFFSIHDLKSGSQNEVSETKKGRMQYVLLFFCCGITLRQTLAEVFEKQNALMGQYNNWKKVPKTMFSLSLF